jgi:recombination protein RecT
MPELVPARQKLVNLRGLLQKQQGEILKAIPKGLDAQRFVRAALTVFARTPKLLDCDTNSVLAAVMQAAQLGLELDPGMGQAYLVPYGKTCTMITGYQGLVALAMRTPDVKSVIARAVYAKDLFDYELGLNETLKHKPTGEPDKGDLTHCYAVAKLVDKDGMILVFEVMSKKEIDAIRARSRAKDSGPWVTDYEMMARKTVVRRLSKWLPKATDFGRAIAAEDRFELGKPGDGVDELVDSLLEEPAIDASATVVGAGDGQPAQAEPAATSLDKLADTIEKQPAATASKQDTTAPAGKTAAPQAAQTTKPAEAPKPKVEHDPRPDAPPSPTARDLSRQEQASRHEVPRAHQTPPPAKPEQVKTTPAPAPAEMTDDEIDWGQKDSGPTTTREPGEEG